MRATLLCLGALLLCALTAAPARAAGNASAAAGFVEQAQNADGGFGKRKGRASDPATSLWATVALLAAGKNPRDEFLKNGRSAEQYLLANRDRYRSLEQLGLLTMVQSASGFGPRRYGNPAAKLAAALTQDAVRRDPRGASLAILGLVAAGNARAANAGAQALLATRTSDGAWGPTGNADSASTALALAALARTGAAGRDHPAVQAGLAYLKQAQTNDGAIAVSTRVDKATAGGSVPATAFTVQALIALEAPQLRTTEGKTARQGLTQYQQQSSGGLTSKGSAYSQVPPSVLETAQAFAAFNGVVYPLRTVRPKTKGPDQPRKKGTKKSKEAGEGQDTSSNRVSDGSSDDGVSGSTGVDESDEPGAFNQAQAGSRGDTSGRAASTKRDRAGREGRRAKGTPSTGSGREVEGTVVGTRGAPGLKTRKGALDDGLTGEQKATIALGIFLAAALLAGLYLERLVPRPTGAPPLIFAGGAAVREALGPLGTATHRAAGFAARDPATGRVQTSRRRWPLAAVGAVGVALIAFPFATGMWDKAPKGATMIDQFAPYMTAERLGSFDRDLRTVEAYARETKRTGLSATQAPQAALFAQQWPTVDRTMSRLMGTMRANRENYQAVAALPRFTLFPWFFVAPGALLVVLAALGATLGRTRPRLWIPLRRATLVVGAGLLLAPVAFGMFDRAPKGAAMVDAFRTVETRANVQTVQGQFGTISVGNGAIASELHPALRRRGLTARQIRQRLPATERLRRRWVPILNNLTPMIGVMSDNVANYRAVAALPRFTVFPWLFLAAGLAALALALAAGRRPVPDLANLDKEDSDDSHARSGHRPRGRRPWPYPRARRAGGQADRHVQDRPR